MSIQGEIAGALVIRLADAPELQPQQVRVAAAPP